MKTNRKKNLTMHKQSTDQVMLSYLKYQPLRVAGK